MIKEESGPRAPTRLSSGYGHGRFMRRKEGYQDRMPFRSDRQGDIYETDRLGGCLTHESGTPSQSSQKAAFGACLQVLTNCVVLLVLKHRSDLKRKWQCHYASSSSSSSCRREAGREALIEGQFWGGGGGDLRGRVCSSEAARGNVVGCGWDWRVGLMILSYA